MRIYFPPPPFPLITLQVDMSTSPPLRRLYAAFGPHTAGNMSLLPNTSAPGKVLPWVVTNTSYIRSLLHSVFVLLVFVLSDAVRLRNPYAASTLKQRIDNKISAFFPTQTTDWTYIHGTTTQKR